MSIEILNNITQNIRLNVYAINDDSISTTHYTNIKEIIISEDNSKEIIDRIIKSIIPSNISYISFSKYIWFGNNYPGDDNNNFNNLLEYTIKQLQRYTSLEYIYCKKNIVNSQYQLLSCLPNLKNLNLSIQNYVDENNNYLLSDFKSLTELTLNGDSISFNKVIEIIQPVQNQLIKLSVKK